MMNSDLGRNPAESVRKKHIAVDSDLGPMPQQDADNYHGHAMYPQKFIRLVGSHASNAATHEADRSGDAHAEAA
jgi:hypothetical protein